MGTSLCQAVSVLGVLLLGACAASVDTSLPAPDSGVANAGGHATGTDGGTDAAQVLVARGDGAVRDATASDAARADAARAAAARADAAALDAALVDASPLDAASGDAAPLDAAADAGAGDPPFSPGVWCTQTPGGLLSGTPGVLAFSYQDCCVERVACTARVDEASSVIELTVTAENFGQLCDCDLSLAQRTCALPALDAGTWAVHINGAYGFELPVHESVAEEPGSLCFHPAGPVGAMLRCEDSAQVLSQTGRACHQLQGLDQQHTQVRVSDLCGGCFDSSGGCSTQVDGDRLHVTPLKRSCACDTCGVCADVCMRVNYTCQLPPLAPGNYRVTYDGLAGETALEVLDYRSLSGPREPGEACVSSEP